MLKFNVFERMNNWNSVRNNLFDCEAVLGIYKPVLILLQICGFDFKVFKFKPVFNVLFKLYSILLLGIITYSSVIYFFIGATYHVWSLLEYSLSVIILMFHSSNLRKFFCKLSEVDTYLRVNRNHYNRDKNKAFLYTIFLWVVRIIYCSFYFSVFTSNREILFCVIVQLSLLALDMNRVWRFILLDAIRYRLKLLRLRLQEDPESNFYLYIKQRKSYKEEKIRFCLHLYRNIANLIDLITHELFNASIFVSIVCSLPKLIINVYHILLIIEHQESYTNVGFIIVHICQICFFLLSPCVVVELYGMEVDSIQLFLMHRIIDEKDFKIKEDLELFLRYTTYRTFRYRIWRCISVNMRLPIAIANMCSTYIIVLINFTHLYG